ncbi:hypothetical protein TWF506_003238 [Arthrobotrys conoides]|uniref:F-box domain-containing protein n=1 Tax=Arthrobotrys conoides TaxID=74498 RepID=A0AAN8N8K7_9PEZI
MANITTLPYELIHDITSKYLTRTCLKSLRIAIPTPIICSATAPLLFQTITLRLGNITNSHEKLISKSEYIKNLPRSTHRDHGDDIEDDGGDNKNNTSDGMFRFVKKLVVDVRYPLAVTETAVRNMDVEGREYRFRPSGDLRQIEEMVGDVEAELFLDTVEEVVRKATRRGQLRFLRVHLSDLMSYKQNKRLLSLVCTPSLSRPHHLSISQTFRKFENLETFISPISNCDNLDLIFDAWPPSELSESQIELVIETISRCPDISGLGIFTRSHDICDEGAKKLWDTISHLTGLERLVVKTMTGTFPEKLGTIACKGLKTLELVRRDSWQGDSGLIGDFLKLLNHSGVKLEKLTVNRYHTYIQEQMLLQTGITSLEIRGKLAMAMEDYATSFWQDVIPVFAPSLKRLRVYSCKEGSWSWYDRDDNLAKIAIRKCKKLEELMISFWAPENRPKNYIEYLVRDLLIHNPVMKQLNMKFCLRDMRKKLNSSDNLLDCMVVEKSEWPGVPVDRMFEVVYDRKTDLNWVAGLFGREEGDRSLAWDRYLQTWRLVFVKGGGRKKEGVFMMEREWDRCCFDE